MLPITVQTAPIPGPITAFPFAIAYPWTETANVEIYYPDQITTTTGGPFGVGIFQFPIYSIDNRENPMRLWNLNTKTVGSFDNLPQYGPTYPTSGTNNFFYYSEATGADNLRIAEAMTSFFHQRQIRSINRIYAPIGGSPVPNNLHVNALDIFDPNSYFSPNGPETGGPEIHMTAQTSIPHGMDASIIRHEMCHAYQHFVGADIAYTPGTEYAAIIEGTADACALFEDHYVVGATSFSFARSAEEFLTFTNYTTFSDHDSGQILSIAIRNMIRMLGDVVPMTTLMHAFTYFQNGDTFVDFPQRHDHRQRGSLGRPSTTNSNGHRQSLQSARNRCALPRLELRYSLTATLARYR